MSENFEKIAIDNLVVEITRKCQLKCAHCLKGDAQNVDMSVEVIDKLLEFDVHGKKQKFCAFTYNGLDTTKAKICVNPEILYVGSNGGRVEVLKLFFKE